MRLALATLLLVFAAQSEVKGQVADGKAAFILRCGSCHGEDGSGGGHGPGILNVRRSRVTSRQSVIDLVRTGIPAAGMPAMALPAAELESIADYVMKLKAPVAPTVGGAGDAVAGERFFTASCAGCHMVKGRGGYLGPDLSTVGRDRTAQQIEDAIRQPGTVPPRASGRRSPATRAVRVELKDGTTLRGIAKNESPFDLQLLSTDGRLHLLVKSQVASVVGEKTLMPKIDATDTQVRDLVAYLSRLRSETAGPLPDGKLGDDGIATGAVTRPQPGSWPTYNGQPSGNRYSELAQIHAGNVSQLAPRWMFTVEGTPRALQTTPIVAGGVMYITSVNEAYALDARSGREIWHYSRPRTPGLAGDAASGINRGAAILGDRIFLVTDHAHLIALHRLTGQLIWDVEMADYRQNYGATSAPLVVDDLVISGVSGGDEGIRGFLDAYKASTGERVWRFWTIPGRGEPGSETWQGRAIEHGCGATWLTGTYDPDLRLLFWPTGNPCPDYNGDERKGDNLYTNSVVALDPATGRLRWHYQFTPHDLHDWDATETPVLVDALFRGERRKLLLQGNRNGFFYVLDRITGKVLSAEPFVRNITWASGIGADGRPILIPGNEPTPSGQRVCPAVAGATNWTSTAFHPGTGLFYLFAEEACSVYSKNGQWWEAGKSFYGGATRRSRTDDGGKFLKALDVQTGKVAWEVADIGGGILGSGLLATAGDLIFYGDGRGAFVAAGARDGRLLWHFNMGQAARSGPMTYSIDGVQYVATAAGSTVIAFALR